MYDVTAAEQVKLVAPSPDNNLYVRIPHPLRSALPDPVLGHAKSRLQKFLKETFWCNQDYYKATLAAIALAKRSENIDRCFIGESSGGTGQSLFSSHLAAVYGHNHAFIDPNLFHNEEEMRKQLEQFAHCWMITAQEAPETHRHFQQDLYKKFMSADDLAGRKPYGFVTKMMRVTGFKRFETNKIMTFRNVMEANFNSIYRRCLVWNPKPNFLESTLRRGVPGPERRWHLSKGSLFTGIFGKWPCHCSCAGTAAWLRVALPATSLFSNDRRLRPERPHGTKG